LAAGSGRLSAAAVSIAVMADHEFYAGQSTVTLRVTVRGIGI
jgi:hypothetical protein